MAHTITSGTPQVMRVIRGDESTANYSSLGEICEAIASRRSDDKNQVLLSERHEFAVAVVVYQLKRTRFRGT